MGTMRTASRRGAGLDKVTEAKQRHRGNSPASVPSDSQQPGVASARWPWSLTALLTCLVVLPPWHGPSWQAPTLNDWVLHHHLALGTKLQYGVDIVFTLGPLGFLFYGITPDTVEWVLLGWCFLGLAYWLASWGVLSAVPALRTRPTVQAAVFAAFLMPLAGLDVPDAFAFVMMAWILLGAVSGTMPSVSGQVILAMAVAVLALVKTSWAIGVPLVVMAVEVSNISSRSRRGLFVSVFATTSVMLWLITGQRLANVVPFALTGMEVAGGFAEAMSLDRPNRWWVIGVYVAVGVCTVGCLMTQRSVKSAVGALALLWLWFIALKAGFVRHDHHELIACTFLFVSAGGVALVTLRRSKLWLIMPAVSLALLVGSTSHHASARRGFVPSYASATLGNVRGLLAALAGHPLWRDSWTRDIVASGSRGTVAGRYDSYPFGDSLLMLQPSAEAACRPIFESYSAYSSRLLKLNGEHLARENAPDFIRFSLKPLDRLLPAMLDGYSWPEIMSRYSAVGSDGNALSLYRREVPLSVELAPLRDGVLPASQAVELGEIGGEPIWVTIRLPLTLYGRVKAFVWKLPPLTITIEMASGRASEWRLVRRSAEAGFIVSPFVRTTEDFARLLRLDTVQTDAVRSFRVSGGREYAWSQATYSLGRVVIGQAEKD